MTLTEKTAYIKGLVEGLELNADEKEVKVINAIIGLLDDMALTVSDLEESMNDMGNQLDEVDEDLYYLEQDFYDEDEDDGEDEEYYEVTCPTCNETICVSEDILSYSVKCLKSCSNESAIQYILFSSLDDSKLYESSQ